MELGQKLRQARLEAGLSQRQLCGDEITRNMLSQIENGSARPSMDTLRFLAGQLGKPISWFLEEQAILSPNQAVMASAREAFAAGDPDRARKELTAYQEPDPVFDWERWLLSAKSAILSAERALIQKRQPYAVKLLEQAAEDGSKTPYYDAETERQRLLLLAQAGQPVTLPNDDRELLHRAKQVMETAPQRAGQYLDAAQDRASPQWQLLRGRAYLSCGQYAEAADCFRAVEDRYPKEAAQALEHCCRELGDYRGAYEYACKLRTMSEESISKF